MSTTNISEELSTYTAQMIPVVEIRPNFEAALARISERKVDSNPKEKMRDFSCDSFGAWFEWD